jgi:hypothetical protein
MMIDEGFLLVAGGCYGCTWIQQPFSLHQFNNFINIIILTDFS